VVNHARHFSVRKEENQLKVLHPIRSYHNFKTAWAAKYASFIAFCCASLDAVRALTSAINAYDLRVNELHADTKKVEGAVGYLARVERYNRESNGHKVNV
jgi:hypothetical protein